MGEKSVSRSTSLLVRDHFLGCCGSRAGDCQVNIKDISIFLLLIVTLNIVPSREAYCLRARYKGVGVEVGEGLEGPDLS